MTWPAKGRIGAGASRARNIHKDISADGHVAGDPRTEVFTRPIQPRKEW